MTNFEKCEYWLELSDDDMLTAKTLLQGKRLLHCGYFCHQAIEKAFKAAIAKNTGEIPPRIHDLPRLGKLGGIWDKMPDEQKETTDNLGPLQIEARYPAYKEQIAQALTRDFCANLVDRTEALLCWIKQQLGILPQDTPRQ